MAAEAYSVPESCFHCGLPVAPDARFFTIVDGESRPMCCVGCCAVAELLESQGLVGWYAHREEPAGAPPESVTQVLDSWIWPSENPPRTEVGRGDKARSDESTGQLLETTVLVEGMRCAACIWLIERYLESHEGVASVSADLFSRRVRIRHSAAQIGLREIVEHLAEIGFRAQPDRPDIRARLDRDENRAALIRLGVAGLGSMNVMTYAVALYAGAFDAGGFANGFEAFFRWMSWIVATPVVMIAAKPFFVGAARDLRVGRPGMDVPVALAIGGAYGVSAWATLRGVGDVYFDSVCMFTFLLSLGRYLEMRARHRSLAFSRRLMQAIPSVARRIVSGVEEVVPAEGLAIGDRLVVRPGEVIPADATVLEGRSGVEEALLTGEPWPRSVSPGDRVIAGSVNASSPLILRASRVGDETSLAAIVALMERAQSEKPRFARVADRVASRFVVVVLMIACGSIAYWSVVSPDRVVWTTLAVLIATCPCALSLATPAALAAATHGLAEKGLLITRGHVLEGLAGTDRFVFDKTGTLTLGAATLVDTVPMRSDWTVAECIDRAAWLEARSEHPFARALVDAATKLHDFSIRSDAPAALESFPGMGVQSTGPAGPIRIGRPEWVAELASGAEPTEPVEGKAPSYVLFGDRDGPIAWFGFEDPIRPEAEEAIAELRALGLSLEMLSGDPGPAALVVAHRVGVEPSPNGVTPNQKLARIQHHQENGERVTMVGDGVNDGPVLSAADISVAMGSGSDLARLGSDAILMRDDLTLLPRSVRWARRTRRVIRQNLGWAIFYNVTALPLALGGYLTPWLAALGMSISSLFVILNSLRLQRETGVSP